MKKILILLLSVMLASSAFAQAKKKGASAAKATTKAKTTAKATTSQPAKPSLAVAPKLSDKEPSFVGFTGSFIQFGKISSEGRSFTIRVEYKPWFFEATGIANAGHNNAELGEDVIAVLAYYNAPGKTADGVDYQAGFFDLTMSLDDEPVRVSNLKFTLIGGATAGAAVLNQAKTWNFEPGRVFRIQKYSGDVIKAEAGAYDKGDFEREMAAAQKRVADSIARERKRVDDSIAAAEREEERRKKAAAAKKRRQVEEYDDDDDYEPPPKKRTQTKQAKKRRVVEEYDDDDDYEPPPKKRKKRN